MAWHRLETTPPEGDMQQALVGGKDLVVCRFEGQFFALENECPHAGGPLAMGNFSGPLIACPWHAWEFDCRTGACVHSDKARLARFAVQRRDGAVFVEIPD